MSNDYIYIAKSTLYDNIYKVGVSANPEKRMDALSADYKSPFNLIYKTLSSRTDSESAAHRLLYKYKSDIFGEKRKEIFKASYEQVLEAVIRACPLVGDHNLSYIMNALPDFIAEKGVESCIHDGYKIEVENNNIRPLIGPFLVKTIGELTCKFI